MQTQKIIEALGYTPNEAKVYLAALQMGECLVTDIAQKLRLPRSSVQASVDTLHKNGLMNFYVKNRYKYWVAANPENLIEQLQRREDMVRAAMPQLARMKKDTPAEGAKPAVHVFEGRDEIRQILDDIIETKQHILAILPNDAYEQLFEGTSIVEDFAEARVRAFLRIRILASDTPAGRELAQEQSRYLRDVRFLPEHISIETASFIYGDKVALVMFNRRQPTAVLIEDHAIRETKSAVFEELWTQSGRTHEREELMRKDSLFKVLADASPQPLLIANEAIEIEYVNSAWERQFGYALEEVRGQNPRMFASGKTPREVYERMWKALKAEQPFQSDEIIDKKKNGVFFNLLTTIFPMRSGKRLYYVQILDDITQRKRVDSMRKNFLAAAAESAPGAVKDIVSRLLDDAFFDA